MVKIKNKTWNKLVRDKIPGIIELNGGRAEIELITDSGRKLELLKDKLVEEATEVKKCGQDGLIEECADVLTVLESIIEASGLDWEYVEQMQAEKDQERGRFEKGIILKTTKGK